MTISTNHLALCDLGELRLPPPAGRQDLPYAGCVAEPASILNDRAHHTGSESTPTRVVERFMELLRRGDMDGAVELLAVDVRYENVGMPTIHGRQRVRWLFGRMSDRGGGFDVRIHTIAANGPSVMTERTDLLTYRRLHVQLWVCGRFDVHNGQITLWRDYFDYVNFTAAMVRGMLGVRLPALRAQMPTPV